MIVAWLRQSYLTCSQKSRYRHKALDQSQQSIRLISVEPALSSDGLIRCRIRHTTVDAQYQCLSYRWGDPTPTRNILIQDGRGRDAPFQVAQNLFDFLSFTREVHSGKSKISDPSLLHEGSVLGSEFWIDAICINQENESERNHQVAQMSNIYSKAKRVIIWLGQTMATQTSHGDITEGLQAFATAMNENRERQLKSPGALSWMHRFIGSEYMRAFCQNEYWKRAWVTQEVVLARQALVLLDNSLFDLAVLTAWLDIWQPPSRFNFLREGKVSLLFLLDYLRDQECSILHDRIFSVLGLVDEGQDIVVDYSVPLAQLACNVLRASRPCLCSALLVIQTLGIHLEPQYLYAYGPCMQFGTQGSSKKWGTSVYTDTCQQLQPSIARLWQSCLTCNPHTGELRTMAENETYLIKNQNKLYRLTDVRVALWAAFPQDFAELVRICNTNPRHGMATPTDTGIGFWDLSLEKRDRLRDWELVVSGHGCSFAFRRLT